MDKSDFLKPESIIYIIDFIPCEFFTPALADCILLASKWQQVPLSLQDTSQYPSRSRLRCTLDCLCSFSDF